MVKLAYIGGAVVLMIAGAAAAQTKPQYSSQDIIKSFTQGAAPSTATTAQDACEAKGMLTGDDGVCEPRKNARGFSLPTRASMKAAPAASAAGASAPAARHVASATTPSHTALRPAAASAAPVAALHRDLLITFKTGSSELTDQAQSNAKVFAQAVNSPQLASAKFEIDGHTDAVGAADKNMTLSQSRADAVKSFLVSQGVDASRLQSKGFGSEQPAVPAKPRAAANRRVEAKRVE